jgi:hypothetical protein
MSKINVWRSFLEQVKVLHNYVYVVHIREFEAGSFFNEPDLVARHALVVRALGDDHFKLAMFTTHYPSFARNDYF